MLPKKKILHLIPSNAIGGVETAAKTSIGIKNNKYIFTLKFLSKQGNKKNLSSRIISLFEIIFSTYQVINDKPDFLIVSLWKSCLSAIVIRCFRPKIKIILFLHLPESVNFLDYFFTFITSRMASQIWGDSTTTIENRTKELNVDENVRKKTISFLAYKLRPNSYQLYKPNFIFWGRIANVKRLDLAINLFYKISEEIEDAKFTIIGPDCGELTYLKKLRDSFNLRNKIQFLEPIAIFKIKELAKDYLFFLQLSEMEGLGMSVMESMQLGLIPIVTEVGEIKNYCINDKNSIIYKDLNSTKIKIINKIKNPNQLKLLHQNSALTWANEKTYREDFKSCLKSLIE